MTPTGCAELLLLQQGSFKDTCQPNESYSSGSWVVSGQLDEPKEFEMDACFQIFGVCLYPHSLPTFTGIDPKDLLNRVQLLSNLSPQWDGAWADLTKQSLDVSSLRAEVEEVLRPTIQRVTPAKVGIFRAIRSLVETPERQISELAEEHALSLRQLQRGCKAFTTYGPKKLTVISRIQKALENATFESITQLAHELEYYDQSHFNNDFKRITGFTPRAFFNQANEKLQWHKQGEQKEP